MGPKIIIPFYYIRETLVLCFELIIHCINCQNLIYSKNICILSTVILRFLQNVSCLSNAKQSQRTICPKTTTKLEYTLEQITYQFPKDILIRIIIPSDHPYQIFLDILLTFVCQFSFCHLIDNPILINGNFWALSDFKYRYPKVIQIFLLLTVDITPLKIVKYFQILKLELSRVEKYCNRMQSVSPITKTSKIVLSC